jgi:hypothetical protein
LARRRRLYQEQAPERKAAQERAWQSYREERQRMGFTDTPSDLKDVTRAQRLFALCAERENHAMKIEQRRRNMKNLGLHFSLFCGISISVPISTCGRPSGSSGLSSEILQVTCNLPPAVEAE